MAANQLTGFQNKFVESESLKDYECPLCLHVTRDPSLTSCCGQHFCHNCITRISTDYKPCPLCKEDNFSLFLDKKQKRKVLDLKVYCEEKRIGCDWIGFLGEFEQHNEKSCIFVSVDCPNNCGSTIQRRILAEHQANNCPKRPHSCEYCQLKGTYQDIEEDHLPVCPKCPVLCPHECGEPPLERDQLEQHEAECPLAMVECELKEVGCEEKVIRKDVDRHMEEAARKHIQLMTTYNIKITRSQAALNDAVVMIQSENRDLKKELMAAKREVANQKRELDLLRSEVCPSLSKTIDHMKTTFVQIHLKNYRELTSSEETRWENPEEFYTFPSRHRMKINLYFRDEKIEIELTHLKLKDAGIFTAASWPKEFTMIISLINQTENSGHFEIEKTLSVAFNHFNDEMYLRYTKIQSGGGKYILNDSLRLQAFVSEVPQAIIPSFQQRYNLPY